MAEVWIASGGPAKGPDQDVRLLQMWWGLFIASWCVTIVVSAAGGEPSLAEDVMKLRGLGALISAVLAVVLIVVVSRLQALQAAMHSAGAFSEGA